MTKKQRILDMLSSKDWHRDATMITKSDFEEMDMNPYVEYGDTYCDVFYARRVLQNAGYTAIIGGYGLYVYLRQ